MATASGDEGESGSGAHAGFFHRSLSPRSFDRLRSEHSDYFYKPKRGPSASKANITITRPIKTFETVTQLVELLTKGNNVRKVEKAHVEEAESPPLAKKFDDQPSTSHYSSFLSMDGADLLSSTSTSSSAFSSRTHSSISTVAEQDTQVVIIDEHAPAAHPTASSSPTSAASEALDNYPSSPCDVPAIGLNIGSTGVHLVLLELYPQNVSYSTIVFQRFLISLIVDNEHHDWSILNVDLRTTTEQEANFRLFSFTHDEFQCVLLRLQSFINYNSPLANSFVLSIALTGEQTSEYESRISSRLSKINLNFDIIQYRAESYMIGLDFLLRKQKRIVNEDELIEMISPSREAKSEKTQLYPYILVHAEVASTFFYIVHSATHYSVVSSSNLCYKTYLNLSRLVQPGFDAETDELPPPPLPSPYFTSSYAFRRSTPASFDVTRQDLCKNCHRLPSTDASRIPVTSFTRLTEQHLPDDYTRSDKPHYIYRGWSNRRTASHNPDLCTFDVHTQTDDSFLQSSALQTRLATRRSLLAMLTMNIALTIKLIGKLHPSVRHCLLTGEFFQLEKQAAQDLTLFLRSVLGTSVLHTCQLKREPLVAALGCALPRVYFDVIDDDAVLGNDCIS